MGVKKKPYQTKGVATVSQSCPQVEDVGCSPSSLQSTSVEEASFCTEDADAIGKSCMQGDTTAI